MASDNIRKEEIKRWWDSPRNLRWDKFYETNDLNSYMISKRLDKTLDILDSINKSELNIIELGCGAGRFTEHIVKYAKLCVSVDMSSAIHFNVEKDSDKLLLM